MSLAKEITKQEQIVTAAYEEFQHFKLIMEEKRAAALRAKSALNNLKAKVYFSSKKGSQFELNV